MWLVTGAQGQYLPTYSLQVTYLAFYSFHKIDHPIGLDNEIHNSYIEGKKLAGLYFAADSVTMDSVKNAKRQLTLTTPLKV